MISTDKFALDIFNKRATKKINNLSKRSIKILDKEGYDKTIEWEWNEDGADDFTETISCICDCVDTDLITYCFAETE